MRPDKLSLTSLRAAVLYLPVLMFVAFLALVVVPGQTNEPVSANPDAAQEMR